MPLFADIATWLAAGAAGALVLPRRGRRLPFSVARSARRRTRGGPPHAQARGGHLDARPRRPPRAHAGDGLCAPGRRGGRDRSPGQPGGPLVVASKPGAPEGSAGSTRPASGRRREGDRHADRVPSPANRSGRPSTSWPAPPGRRSRGPSAFARRACRPTSTRSRASTTAATSTRRSHASARARGVTNAASPSSSSTSTTSSRSTTASDTSQATTSSPQSPSGSAPSCAGRTCLPDRRRRVRGDPPRGEPPDAERLYGRIEAAVSFDLTADAARLQISAGVAELGPEGRRRLALPACRRGSLPLQSGRQGPGAGGRRQLKAACSGSVNSSPPACGKCGKRRARQSSLHRERLFRRARSPASTPRTRRRAPGRRRAAPPRSALRSSGSGRGEPLVPLVEPRDGQLRPTDPCGGHVGRLPHLEPQPPDRQCVRRGREAEIDVGAALELRRALRARPDRAEDDRLAHVTTRKLDTTDASCVCHRRSTSTV